MLLFVDIWQRGAALISITHLLFYSLQEKNVKISRTAAGFLGYIPWLLSFFGYRKAGVSSGRPAATFVNCIVWYTKYTVIGRLGVPFVTIFTHATRRTAPQNSCGPLLKMKTPLLGNISSSWKFPFVNLMCDTEFIIFIAAARMIMIMLHGTFHALWLCMVALCAKCWSKVRCCEGQPLLLYFVHSDSVVGVPEVDWSCYRKLSDLEGSHNLDCVSGFVGHVPVGYARMYQLQQLLCCISSLSSGVRHRVLLVIVER